MEEHSKTGGFGESIKSFICDNNLQKNIINLGTDDMFLPSIGSQSFARTFFKIDCSAIANAGLSLNEPTMIIGLDLDNTIAAYEDALHIISNQFDEILVIFQKLNVRLKNFIRIMN